LAKNMTCDGTVGTVASRGFDRLAAAASREKMKISFSLCEHVARGSSGLKPLHRRAPKQSLCAWWG